MVTSMWTVLHIVCVHDLVWQSISVWAIHAVFMGYNAMNLKRQHWDSLENNHLSSLNFSSEIWAYFEFKQKDWGGISLLMKLANSYCHPSLIPRRSLQAMVGR